MYVTYCTEIRERKRENKKNERQKSEKKIKRYINTVKAKMGVAGWMGEVKRSESGIMLFP